MKYRKRWLPHVRETRQQRRAVLVVVVSQRRKRRRKGGNKRSNIQYAFIQRHIPQNQLEKERKDSSYSVWCFFLLSELQPHFDLLVAFSLFLSHDFFFLYRCMYRLIIQQYLGYPRVPFLFFFSYLFSIIQSALP